MRIIALVLGMAVLMLALITAGWHADAHRYAGENEQLERQIARLEREASREAEDVDRLRQPNIIEARLVDLSKAPARVPDSKLANNANNSNNINNNNSKNNYSKPAVAKNDKSHSPAGGKSVPPKNSAAPSKGTPRAKVST